MNTHCNIAQLFGQNANEYYKSVGLKGHTGYDEICGYGSLVRPYLPGLLYSAYTPEKPASDGYTSVYVLSETPLELFEVSYGHISKVMAPIGSRVATDTVIAREGNKGVVYSNGQRITLEMQAAGDQRGSHRHVQFRPVKRVRQQTNPSERILAYEGGFYKDADGFFYETLCMGNGYAGCVDPFGQLWPRDLYLGVSGYDVLLLQRALVKEGYATFEPTGFYGPMTLAAVRSMQIARKISPALGYFGPKTRAIYNGLYYRLK